MQQRSSARLNIFISGAHFLFPLRPPLNPNCPIPRSRRRVGVEMTSEERALQEIESQRKEAERLRRLNESTMTRALHHVGAVLPVRSGP